MDGRRVGRALRAVRLHKRLRQRDVAEAGVSQSVVSRAEHGRLDVLSFEPFNAVASVLDVTLFIDARWNSGDVDRLIDRVHARLVERVVRALRRDGWEVLVEYGFNHYGDREVRRCPRLARRVADAVDRRGQVPAHRSAGDVHVVRT